MKKELCLIACLFALITFNSTCYGQEFMQKGYITLTSGKYTINISATFNYTMRSFKYNGVELIKPSGFCGTVIATKPGKFIGAGHKEGGAERLEAVQLSIDGNTAEIKNGQGYTGNRIILKKVSFLDNLKQVVTLTLTPEGLTESKSFEAIENQDLHLVYAFLLCWSTDTKDWIATLADGKTTEGTFTGSNKFLLEKDIKWTAVYAPGSETGVVMYFPKVIPGKGRKSTYWDVKNAYHKYYLMMNVPGQIKKGFASKDNTIIIKAFNAKQDGWKKKAASIIPAN
jgi:hypothetical protein